MENVLDLQAMEAPENTEHHDHHHSHYSLHCGDSTLSLLLCY